MGMTKALLPSVIKSGFLPAGTILRASTGNATATVVPGGLELSGQVFIDPSEAMRWLLKTTSNQDNGWLFWMMDDPNGGIARPIEHRRLQFKVSLQPQLAKTSLSHPLQIDMLEVPGLPGRLGLTFCPGKQGEALFGGVWERDLELDLETIADWRANTVVTLMEAHEFALLGVPDFPAVMQQHPFTWHWLQIRDGDIPDERFESQWPQVSQQLFSELRRGQRVVIHCRGGLGRTGLVAARILTEQGVPPEKAIRQVRDTRPGTIETWSQEAYVRNLAP